MEAFGVLFDFVDKWGLPLVLLLILVRWLAPKIDQLWSKAMGIPVSTGNVHHLAYIAKLDVKVSDILHEVMNTYDCQWVTLWQYHNGEYSLSGSPFLKISATHQKYVAGKRGWADGYQRLPVSLIFSPVLFTTRCQKITAENVTEFGYGALFRQAGIKTAYVIPIYNSSAVHVANLSISYDRETDLDDDTTHMLEKYAGRIATLLEVSSVIPRNE